MKPRIFMMGDYLIDHMWNVLNGPVGKEILDNFKEKNTRMLGIAYFDEGPRHFMLRGKPVKSVGDLKGLKIKRFSG